MPVQILIDENGAIDAVITVSQVAVEIIATVIRQDDKMTLEGVHVEKLSGSSLDRRQIDRLCDQLCQHYQIDELTIRGARRTTGKSVGRFPRPHVYRVPRP
jgi:hypothetical protein